MSIFSSKKKNPFRGSIFFFLYLLRKGIDRISPRSPPWVPTESSVVQPTNYLISLSSFINVLWPIQCRMCPSLFIIFSSFLDSSSVSFSKYPNNLFTFIILLVLTSFLPCSHILLSKLFVYPI